MIKHAAQIPISTIDDASPESKGAEITAFTSYFELLSQIDTRLQKEDPEYLATYYPETALGKE